MKAGKVARIRVNPRDAMSSVDLCKVTWLNPGSMSFSQVVSSNYSALLEMMRKQGTIPRRDGFEYLQMMGELKAGSSAEGRAEAALTAPRESSAPSGPNAVERMRLDIRWNELTMRKNLTPENFTDEEASELKELCTKLGLPVD